MDRSFLSQKDVIEASRDFVCIRLATYESAAEAKVLKSIWVSRDGDIKNTTFAILSPDGRRLLTDAGRGPDWALGRGGAAEQAQQMTRIAREFRTSKSPAALPTCADLRRALNIAACDMQPLVVAIGKPGEPWIAKSLAKLAWNDDFIGRFVWATASRDELDAIDGVGAKDKLIVVQPDDYGLTGTVIARSASRPTAIAKALRAGLDAFRVGEKDSRRHIRRGQRTDKQWKPAIEVTDGPTARRRDR